MLKRLLYPSVSITLFQCGVIQWKYSSIENKPIILLLSGGAFFLASCALLYCIHQEQRLSTPLPHVAVLLFFCIILTLLNIPSMKLDKNLESKSWLHGKVIEVHSFLTYNRILIRFAAPIENRDKTLHKAILFSSKTVNLNSGDKILFKSSLTCLNKTDPNSPPSMHSLKRQGIWYKGYLNETDLLVVKKQDIAFMASIRNFLKKRIDLIFDANTASIVTALICGDKSRISQHQRTLFLQSGTIHVLAASGLHVGIISFCVLTILQSLGIKKRYSSIFTVLVITAYYSIAGTPVSLLRALIMFTVIACESYFYIKTDMVNTLFITVTFILALYPWELFSPGFQLSAGATFGIILFFNNFKELFGKTPSIISSPIALSLSACTITTPLIWYHFKTADFAGLLSSIIAIPLISIILSGGIVSIFLSCFNISWAVLITGIVAWIANLLSKFLLCISQLKLHFSTCGVPIYIPLFSLIVIIMVLHMIKKRRRTIIVVCIIISWYVINVNSSQEIECNKHYSLPDKSYLTYKPQSNIRTFGNDLMSHRIAKALQWQTTHAIIAGELHSMEAARKALMLLTQTRIPSLTIYMTNTDHANSAAFSFLLQRLPVTAIFIPNSFQGNNKTELLMRIIQYHNISLHFYNNPNSIVIKDSDTHL